MGLFTRARTTEVQFPAANQYTPADQAGSFKDELVERGGAIKDELAARGGLMVDKATQVYKKHPKLIGGLALVAGAAILASMKRRGR